MSTRSFANVLVLCAALVIGAGPYLVRAAGVRPPGDVIAQVDLQHVYALSDARKAAEVRIREYGRTLFERFQRTAQQRYLSADELSDLSEAVNAPNPTDSQKKRVADLTTESGRRVSEMQALTAKRQTDLSDADRKRIQALSDIEAARPRAVDQLRSLYQQMVNDEDAKQTRQGISEIRGVIAKLARDKGVTEVFDTSCLVSCPIDLTADAIQRVQAKRK